MFVLRLRGNPLCNASLLFISSPLYKKLVSLANYAHVGNMALVKILKSVPPLCSKSVRVAYKTETYKLSEIHLFVQNVKDLQ